MRKIITFKYKGFALSILIIFLLSFGHSNIIAGSIGHSYFIELPMGISTLSSEDSMIRANDSDWIGRMSGEDADENESELVCHVIRIGDTWYAWVGWSMIYASIKIEKD